MDPSSFLLVADAVRMASDEKDHFIRAALFFLEHCVSKGLILFPILLEGLAPHRCQASCGVRIFPFKGFCDCHITCFFEFAEVG